MRKVLSRVGWHVCDWRRVILLCACEVYIVSAGLVMLFLEAVPCLVLIVVGGNYMVGVRSLWTEGVVLVC